MNTKWKITLRNAGRAAIVAGLAAALPLIASWLESDHPGWHPLMLAAAAGVGAAIRIIWAIIRFHKEWQDPNQEKKE